MEMGDHYAFADLRQLIAGRTATLFPTEEQFNGHRNLTTTTAGTGTVGHQHYEMLMLGSSSTSTDHHHHHHQLGGASGGGGGGGDQLGHNHDHQIVFPHHRGGGVIDFCSSATHDDSTNPTTTTTNSNNTGSGGGGGGGFCGLLEMDGGGGGGGGYMQMINHIGIGGGDGGGGGGGGGGGNINISRWPRQETLSLLEIRSHLDSKFKEANQKGPLWDEVSRIMAEEHGYERSGKKCREKFENLYKYYKKTKEGKAGRQDGKHYRFFRQLEALYGETSSSNIPNSSSALSSETSTHAHHHLGTTTTSSQHHNLLHQFQTNIIHTSTSSQSNHNIIQEQEEEEEEEGRLMQVIPADHDKLCCESLSLSNSSEELDTSSSEDNDHDDLLSTDHPNTTIAFMENNIGHAADDHHDYSMDDQKRKNKKYLMIKDNPSDHKKAGKRISSNWKAKIRDFVDSRMKKLMETQEAWLDKMLKTLEHKERERISREEEWRKQESARIDREHKFWAKERAWFEARDAALMEALQRFTGTELNKASVLPGEERRPITEVSTDDQNHIENGSIINSRWSEAEISSLIQLRSSSSSTSGGSSDHHHHHHHHHDQEAADHLWEDISVKMACLGYHRSAKKFQEKWESIENYFRKTNEYCCNKKRRENSRTVLVGPNYYYHHDQQHLDSSSTYSHQGEGGGGVGFQGQGVLVDEEQQGPEIVGIQLNDGPSPSSNSNAGPTGGNDHHHCFRFLMNHQGGDDNLWENNYGMKINKGGT